MSATDSWESTLTVLTRARGGDARALDDLLARYMPALQRWGRGRLPVSARDDLDLDREIECAFDVEEPMAGRAPTGDVE